MMRQVKELIEAAAVILSLGFFVAVLWTVADWIEQADADAVEELQYYAAHTEQAVKPDWYEACAEELDDYAAWAVCAVNQASGVTEGVCAASCPEPSSAASSANSGSQAGVPSTTSKSN